ncbi:MAG: glycosyltransferase family 2 protein [Chloroflexi bacterium]|nr:MAG: glycosyltransferase family 2 protein [Chloroflexota bacterium]
MSSQASHIHPRILVVIPALNEAENIGRVVSRIKRDAPDVDVAVINDGSTDATGRIAAACGAIVLNLPYNVGIGAAVQTGLRYALEHAYEIVVRSDGDGQHTSEYIDLLITTLLNEQADLVVGSRFLQQGGSTSFTRRVGIIILANMISLIIGQRITDPTSGFVAFSRRALTLCAHNFPHDYPEPESLVLLHRAGLRIREVPVTMHPREGGQSSITALSSIYYMFKVILAILISLLRPAPVVDAG